MDNTEPVVASRSVWLAILEMVRHTEMSLAERILSVTITPADYETKFFLALRLKILTAVKGAYEEEDLKKLGGEKDVKEVSVEINLNIAEATYLDMTIRVADFKGALTLKRALWAIITTLCERHERERE